MKVDTQFSVPHEDIKHKDTLLQLLKERAYRKGQYTLSQEKRANIMSIVNLSHSHVKVTHSYHT